MPPFPQLSVEDEKIHDSFGAVWINKESDWQGIDSFGAAHATVLGRYSLFHSCSVPVKQDPVVEATTCGNW